MTITHEHMMALTANMPMKCIEINGEPYLERYFAQPFDSAAALTVMIL